MLLCAARGACCNSTITDISFVVLFQRVEQFYFLPLFNRCFSCGLNCFSFCSDSAWALKAPKLEKTSAILKSVDVVFSLKLP